jgi:tryptophan-rich sensory protein
MVEHANIFLLGANVMACVVAVAFFARFWRKTRDRLFLWFAIAFLLLGANWTALAFTERDEVRTALYVLRLLAFIIILYAIVEKNRAARSRP